MPPATSSQQLAEAAGAFLDLLDDQSRHSAHLPFPSDEERRDWTYLPRQRLGLSLAEMDRARAKAAHRLLAAGLSSPAYAQAAAIMALEDVLDELQGGEKGRHSGDYWLAVFGDPGTGPWGWRMEGHHLSVNYTVGDDGSVRATPLFLGANPARLEQEGATLLEPLAREEALAFALLGTLSPSQRAQAVVSDEAPSDILTGDEVHVGGVEPQGVRLGELSGRASELARSLVDLYLDRLPADLAAGPRTPDDLGSVRLAWAGPTQPGRPHYYRLQGPRLLVELDNTQDGANHVHTVWRDPEGDFGEDLLAAHHRAHHSSG